MDESRFTYRKEIDCKVGVVLAGEDGSERAVEAGFVFCDRASARVADAFEAAMVRLRDLPGGAELAGLTLAKTIEAMISITTVALEAEAAAIEAKLKRSTAAKKAAATRAGKKAEAAEPAAKPARPKKARARKSAEGPGESYDGDRGKASGRGEW